MKTEDVLSYLEKIATKAENKSTEVSEVRGLMTRAREFFRVHVGDKSEFYNAIFFIDEEKPDGKVLASVIRNFQEYVRDGYSNEFSPVDVAQINVISDFMEQARLLLADRRMHPASSCIIVGAALENFLRNWVERKSIKIGNRKPSINTFAEALLEGNEITKQDMKDLVAWGGLRNEAAHGNWEALSDKTRAKIMAEGVNLFMRKYSEQTG